MNAYVIYSHLIECGAVVKLAADGRSLDIDAPADVLTPELVEMIQGQKAELVELVYALEEAEAIEIEGRTMARHRPYKPGELISELYVPAAVPIDKTVEYLAGLWRLPMDAPDLPRQTRTPEAMQLFEYEEKGVRW